MIKFDNFRKIRALDPNAQIPVKQVQLNPQRA